MAHAKGWEIRQYMRSVLAEYTDAATGEVNCTAVSEDAADHFEWYGAKGDVPEVLYEWALDVVDHERARQSGDFPAILGGLVAAYDHKCERG